LLNIKQKDIKALIKFTEDFNDSMFQIVFDAQKTSFQGWLTKYLMKTPDFELFASILMLAKNHL
jgi:hypothetical protein